MHHVKTKIVKKVFYVKMSLDLKLNQKSFNDSFLNFKVFINYYHA